MKITKSKIVILCPHKKTGGPELQHQLVNQLNKIGRKAFICYFPFEQDFTPHEEYLKYEAPICKFIDDSETFFLVSESATFLIKSIKNADYGIWWLSVDNYYRSKGDLFIRDFFYKYLSLFKSRVPISQLNSPIHFTQSAYAKYFLEQHNINSYMLSDYLSQEHTVKFKSNVNNNKDDIIVFNPKKGKKITSKLIKLCTGFNFVPIQGMSSSEVSDLLNKAKIYIDFGNHPGKDRLPREAAISGCCVITNKNGSAKNRFDIPISSIYKLDDTSRSFFKEFESLALEILEDFVFHSSNFDEYRLKIFNEQKVFKDQVINLFK